MKRVNYQIGDTCFLIALNNLKSDLYPNKSKIICIATYSWQILYHGTNKFDLSMKTLD